MSVLRRAKLRTPDGTESIEYPLGVEAKNVEVANQENLSQRLVRIDEDLEKNEEDIAAVSELAGRNKQNIGAAEVRIDALERRSASVEKKPYYFNTVADMKAYSELKEGDMAITLGYYEANDGGGAEYKIVSNNNQYIVNLNNSLFAELIVKENYTPKVFGCKEDGITDDTMNLQYYFDNMYRNNFQIKLSSNKTYLITNSILLDEYIYLEGNNAKIYCTANCPALRNRGTTKLQSSIIRDLRLQGANNNEYTDNIGIYFAGVYSNFENLNISNFYDGIKQYSTNISGNQVTCKFNNLNIRYNSHYGINLGESANGKITDGWITNTNIGSGVCGLYIGSCKGYMIDNLHFWGNENPIVLHDTAYSNINNIYIEGFSNHAISCHLLGDVYFNNLSLNITQNDAGSILYFYRSQNPVNDIYGLSLSNIIATCDTNEIFGTFIDSENRSFPNVKYSNIVLSPNITFSVSNQFRNPFQKLQTKTIIDCDTTDGNSVIIPIPLLLQYQNYYKCKITLYGRRYNYSNFNASAIYDCIISQGGSDEKGNASLLEIQAPTGFNENPVVNYSYANKELILSFKTNNAYPLCIFIEWFKED